jgi:hypothetical protein
VIAPGPIEGLTGSQRRIRLDVADAIRPVAGVSKLLLGALMLFMAVTQWRSRPHGDEEPAQPVWKTAIAR